MDRPIFTGRHIRAFERDHRHGPQLVIEATSEPAFTQPPGTVALYVAIDGLVDVRGASIDAAYASITIVGDLTATGYGTHVELGPILAEDVARLVPLLLARYRLPKVPRVGHFGAAATELVTMIGTYQGRSRGANFGRYALLLDDAQRAQIVAGQPIHVIGFQRPARVADPGMFAGPWLQLLAWAPTHLVTPCPICDGPPSPRRVETAAIAVTTWLGRGEPTDSVLDFHQQRGDALTFGMLVGTGAQGSGDLATGAARMVLAELLGEPAYGPLAHIFRAPPDDTPATDLPAWVPVLVDRARLPLPPRERLPVLAQRIGAVIDALNARRAALQVHGVLGHIAGRTLTLYRRGTSRVYLARAGTTRLVVPEHSAGQILRSQGAQPPPMLDQIMVSAFAATTPEPGAMLELPGVRVPEPKLEPPLEGTLAPGDRLLIVPHLVYDQCDEATLVRGLHDPASLVRELPGRCPKGWGVTVIEAKGQP